MDPFMIGAIGGALAAIAEDISKKARIKEAESKAQKRLNEELEKQERELRKENDRLVNEVLKRKKN